MSLEICSYFLENFLTFHSNVLDRYVPNCEKFIHQDLLNFALKSHDFIHRLIILMIKCILL